MPSFDIVSKVNNQEVVNAVDQSNREITTRFDFRDANASVEFSKNIITLRAASDFQLKQLDEILRSKLAKRQVDVRSLDYKPPEINLNEARQAVEIKQGIDTDSAKKIVKFIKEKQFKVQATIQGEHVRVTGKKKDDLQIVMTILRGSKLDLPLQFENFRD